MELRKESRVVSRKWGSKTALPRATSTPTGWGQLLVVKRVHLNLEKTPEASGLAQEHTLCSSIVVTTCWRQLLPAQAPFGW